ncbi:MAG: hypothetical protein E6I97_28265 [Chloroflexi bacterium]|nr:MAG: hypothetical protein E6I97_28265 [Chloroflexota bacterium]
MKNISLPTNVAPFVERLKQFISALFHFLDWFTPAHPFIAEKRARTFLISFTMLFFELLCIRWIPSYVRYLSYFNNFLVLASFLGIGLGMLSARRERFWFPPFPLLLGLLVLIIARTKFQLIINSTQVLYFGIVDEQAAQSLVRYLERPPAAAQRETHSGIRGSRSGRHSHRGGSTPGRRVLVAVL